MTEGTAALAFVEDIIKLLTDKWTPNKGGKRPEIKKYWEVKEVGFVDSNYAKILVSIDSENPQIFSMLQGDATDREKFEYDWLHEVSLTLDIRTGVSEVRILQLLDHVMFILKHNVVPLINGHEYIQMLPENPVSMNEEYRNLYRYTVGVTAMRFNP